jgi:hypothetical protein
MAGAEAFYRIDQEVLHGEAEEIHTRIQAGSGANAT